MVRSLHVTLAKHKYYERLLEQITTDAVAAVQDAQGFETLKTAKQSKRDRQFYEEVRKHCL